ncbi:MAG: hypothetical protein RJA99_1714 [Pseudomonadota bacterium]|jgi:hypothetical protein
MDRRAALLATALAVAAGAIAPVRAQSRELVYEGTSEGVVTRLLLRLDGPRVRGTLLESGLSLPVEGRIDGRRLDAAVLDPGSRAPLVRIAGELRDDGATITARPETGGAARTLAMTRVADVAAPPARPGSAAAPGSAAGRRDPALVGRWVNESQINSPGGAGGFASMSTVRTMELAADGGLRQWVRTVGGGGNWSSDGGERLEFSGRWETRGAELWVQPDGQPQFVRAAAWRMSGAYLVLEDGRSKQVWRR